MAESRAVENPLEIVVFRDWAPFAIVDNTFWIKSRPLYALKIGVPASAGLLLPRSSGSLDARVGAEAPIPSKGL